MYSRLGRRRALNFGLADPADRATPAEFHEGTHRDFLRRHQEEAQQLAHGNRRERERFAATLFSRATDERNLRIAIDYTARQGQAPGPNGLRLRNLDENDRWILARTLRNGLRAHNYGPGEPRACEIPKGGDRGNRTIWIPNAEDRVIQRAIVQVVQPFVDPRFLNRSYGFRPGKTRELALATANVIARRGGRWTWLTEDLKNAFDSVPHARLVDAIRSQLPAPEIIDLISLFLTGPRNRGITQGGPLSPFLLNVYLHQVLDRWWTTNAPETTLLRYADDLLVLAGNHDQARTTRQRLVERLRPFGLNLKDNELVHDLEEGQRASWLGFNVVAFLCRETKSQI